MFDDARDLITSRMGSYSFPRARGWTLAGAIFGKAVFIGWAFALPIALHPTWWLIPLWLIAVFTLGNVMAAVFQLAHCVGAADFVQASPGAAVGSDWAAHQVATTVDFARDNPLLSWFLGGLNFQVEHHLFPKVCHVHYRALAAIVEETCRAHGLRYRVEPTLGSALGSNLRWIRLMGRSAPKAAA